MRSWPVGQLVAMAIMIAGIAGFGTILLNFRRRKAAQADIGCGLEVGVLYARGDRDLLGIGIIDDVDPSPG
jgi:hypothetical protein